MKTLVQYIKENIGVSEDQEDLCNVLAMLNDLDVDEFLTEDEDMYKDFFEELDIVLKQYKFIRPSYKVHSFWFTDGRLVSSDKPKPASTRFVVTAEDRNYKETKIDSKDILNNMRCTEEVFNILWDLVCKVEDSIKSAAKLPDVNKVTELVLQACKKYINPKYTADIEKGKRQSDGKVPDYDAIVIRNKSDKSYHGSITVGKLKHGGYSLSERMPLSGESSIEFKLGDIDDTVQNRVDCIK